MLSLYQERELGSFNKDFSPTLMIKPNLSYGNLANNKK